MAYASVADLVARYGEDEIIELTDRVNAGAVDAAAAAAALADAEAEADAHLGARYPVPLAAAPPLLVGIVCAIARYRLWADAASERVRDGYTDARRQLEGIASGKISLGIDAPPAPSGVVVAAATVARPLSDALANGYALH